MPRFDRGRRLGTALIDTAFELDEWVDYMVTFIDSTPESRARRGYQSRRKRLVKTLVSMDRFFAGLLKEKR